MRDDLDWRRNELDQLKNQSNDQIKNQHKRSTLDLQETRVQEEARPCDLSRPRGSRGEEDGGRGGGGEWRPWWRPRGEATAKGGGGFGVLFSTCFDAHKEGRRGERNIQNSNEIFSSISFK